MQTQPVLRRATAVLSAVAMTLLGLVVAASPAQAAITDIIINEFYGRGGSANQPYTHKFVELYNPTSVDVSLAGTSLQYRAATSTDNATGVAPLTGTIKAGGYFLVALNSNGSTGVAIPAPDASTGLLPSGTAGTIFLASVTTATSPDATASIIDKLGYGGSNSPEGAAVPYPGTNATPGSLNRTNFADTNNNAADFTFSSVVTPQNSAPPGDAAPLVASVAPANGGTSSASGPITVSFSEPVNVTSGALSLNCSPSGVVTLAVTGGPTTFTLTPTSALTDGDSCTLRVPAASVTDEDTDDPPNEMASDYTSSFTVLDLCVAAVTSIPAIQGSGATAAITGSVTTRGVVVGDYEGASPNLRGFYLQDAIGDGDPATSDAIFIFNGGNQNVVSVGDLVTVRGTAGENQGQTQISTSATQITACGTGAVSPTDVTLPIMSGDYLERYEGMLVAMPQTLYVTEHFQLGRFGQVVVSSGGRLQQPTNVVAPGADANALQAANNLNRIIIDDNLQSQNPDPIVFARDGQPLSAGNTLRGGDTITDATGVMTYTWAGNGASGNAYRLRPIGALDGSFRFESGNPRPEVPTEVGGDVKVASFNVLNYFLTVDQGPDVCGPAKNQDCRGADSGDEFDRQRVKILEALEGLDADIVGLIEMENTPGVEPAADLVEGLNERMGAGSYDYIDTGVIGTDAIRLGFMYKPDTVQPLGEYAILDSEVDPRFIDDLNRPMLTQTFEEVATRARVTVSVNHLKSKGSDCNDVGDFDLDDGQGNCNLTRVAAAQAIADFLAGDPTDSGDPDHLIIGDLNAYAMEGPVTALEDSGYTNLLAQFAGVHAYTYAFDGQWGYLDHALASGGLLGQITGATSFHINADEPGILDYNTEFKSSGQTDSLFAPDPYRSSDHDPVLVGLDLDGPADFVADLRETVAEMDLQRGIANALDAKLRDAERAIDRGDDFGACASMQSFIDQVNALAGKKLDPELAEILIEDAVALRRALDC